MSKLDHDSFAVGYGKPPEKSRFKKGVSGNPTGRPKGSLNFFSVVEKALNTMVNVTEGGRRKSRSKLEVAITQVTNKAAAGNLPAFKTIMSLMPAMQTQGTLTKGASAHNTSTHPNPDLAADRELALRVVARWLKKSEG